MSKLGFAVFNCCILCYIYHFLSYISMYKLKIQVIGMFVSSCLRVFLERVFRFFLRFPETFDIIKAIYIIILTLALYHLICIAIFVLSAVFNKCVRAKDTGFFSCAIIYKCADHCAIRHSRFDYNHG